MIKIIIISLILLLAISCSPVPLFTSTVTNRTSIPVNQAITVQVDNTRTITLHRATYQEICNFIDTDNTDTYLISNFANLTDLTCVDFAITLRNNAIANNIECGFVGLIISDNNKITNSGHAINVFDTSDAGLVYVEPQVDGIFNIELTVGHSMTKLYQQHMYSKHYLNKSALALCNWGTQVIHRIQYVW